MGNVLGMVEQLTVTIAVLVRTGRTQSSLLTDTQSVGDGLAIAFIPDFVFCRNGHGHSCDRVTIGWRERAISKGKESQKYRHVERQV